MYVKVLVGNFNQEKALAGAFSVITKLLVEALISTLYILRSLWSPDDRWQSRPVQVLSGVLAARDTGETNTSHQQQLNNKQGRLCFTGILAVVF